MSAADDLKTQLGLVLWDAWIEAEAGMDLPEWISSKTQAELEEIIRYKPEEMR